MEIIVHQGKRFGVSQVTKIPCEKDVHAGANGDGEVQGIEVGGRGDQFVSKEFRGEAAVIIQGRQLAELFGVSNPARSVEWIARTCFDNDCLGYTGVNERTVNRPPLDGVALFSKVFWTVEGSAERKLRMEVST